MRPCLLLAVVLLALAAEVVAANPRNTPAALSSSPADRRRLQEGVTAWTWGKCDCPVGLTACKCCSSWSIHHISVDLCTTLELLPPDLVRLHVSAGEWALQIPVFTRLFNVTELIDESACFALGEIQICGAVRNMTLPTTGEFGACANVGIVASNDGQKPVYADMGRICIGWDPHYNGTASTAALSGAPYIHPPKGAEGLHCVADQQCYDCEKVLGQSGCGNVVPTPSQPKTSIDLQAFLGALRVWKQ